MTPKLLSPLLPALVLLPLLAVAGLQAETGPVPDASDLRVVSASQDGSLAPVAARPASTLVDSYGVCVHMAYTDTSYRDTSAAITALEQLGVQHVRDDLFLDNPGEYRAWARLGDAGIGVDMIAGRPDSTGSVQDYVDTITDDLPGVDVDAIEGPNEWDVSGRSNWAQELRTYQTSLYRTVRSTSALHGVPVLAPSLAFSADDASLGTLSGVSDIANSHDYTGGQVPSYELGRAMTATRQRSNNRSVYITETGYHNAIYSHSGHRPVPESVSALYQPRALLDSVSHGVDREYTYELMDEHSDPSRTDPESHFGLIRYDGTRKPAYYAMQNLLALAADPDAGRTFRPADLDYRITGSTSDVQQMLLQRSDGTWLLMLWRDVSIFNPGTQRAVSVKPTTVDVELPRAMDATLYHPTSGARPVASGTATSVPVRLDAAVSVLSLDTADGASPYPTTGTTDQGDQGDHARNPSHRPSRPQALRAVGHGSVVRVHWRHASGVTRYRLVVGHARHLLSGHAHRARVHVRTHLRPRHRHGHQRSARRAAPRFARVVVRLRAHNAHGWSQPRILHLRLRR